MSELFKLHQQLEYLGTGVSYIIAIFLTILMYYIYYLVLKYIIKQGVKAALAESCNTCKNKHKNES